MGGLTVGVVHQPIVGEQRCGDAYVVIERGDYFVVAAADGLGHGAEAEQAARKAIACVEAHAEQPPEVILAACHQALRGSRGAVLAIARVSRTTSTLRHAGLGNIDTRLVARDRVRRPVTVNGIVGYEARKLRAEEFPFHPGDLLIMHSDGISDRFEVTPASRSRDPQMLANQLAHAHGKHSDDQLLLIVRDDAWD